MKKSIVSIIILAAFLICFNSSTQSASDAKVYREVLDKCKDSIVNVTYVLNVKMDFGQGSNSKQQKDDTKGIVLTKEGLILLSNSKINAGIPPAALKQLGKDMDIRPADFKVVLPDGTELPAKLLVRDSNLDIAFLKVTDLKGKELKPVKIDTSKKMDIGDTLIAVTRYGKTLHYIPRFHTFIVNAQIDTPRLMYDVEGRAAPELGMGLFDEDANLVGVLVNIPELFKGISEDESSRMRSQTEEITGYYVLPVDNIASAMKRVPKNAPAAEETESATKVEKKEEKPEKEKSTEKKAKKKFF